MDLGPFSWLPRSFWALIPPMKGCRPPSLWTIAASDKEVWCAIKKKLPKLFCGGRADQAWVPVGFCSTSSSSQQPQVNTGKDFKPLGNPQGHPLSHTSSAPPLDTSSDSEREISVRHVQFMFLYAPHCLNFSSLCFFRLHCKTLKVVLIALLINCFLGHTVPLTAD